jgi:hypothetical protein
MMEGKPMTKPTDINTYRTNRAAHHLTEVLKMKQAGADVDIKMAAKAYMRALLASSQATPKAC